MSGYMLQKNISIETKAARRDAPDHGCRVAVPKATTEIKYLTEKNVLQTRTKTTTRSVMFRPEEHKGHKVIIERSQRSQYTDMAEINHHDNKKSGNYEPR